MEVVSENWTEFFATPGKWWMLQAAFLLTGGGKFAGGSAGCGGLVAKSCLTLATPWTVAHQAPLSIKFSRHEYWSRWPLPSPGDLPDPGIKPESLASPVLASGFFTSWITGQAQKIYNTVSIFLSHPIFLMPLSFAQKIDIFCQLEPALQIFSTGFQMISQLLQICILLEIWLHIHTNKKIWKTQQWPQDWKRSVFIPIPKKGKAKECSNYCTIAFISHASKVMLKILQARLNSPWPRCTSWI